MVFEQEACKGRLEFKDRQKLYFRVPLELLLEYHWNQIEAMENAIDYKEGIAQGGK